MDSDNTDHTSANQSADIEEDIDLNSPRFIEACKRQGILPSELLQKSLQEIKDKYKNQRLNREGMLLAAEHYEERRIAKLKMVVDERNRIIDEQSEEAWKSKQKGRTISYTPKKQNFKNLKEKQLLREMIVDQQREIDMLMMNGKNVKGGLASYQQLNSVKKAINTFEEDKRAAGRIEVLDENQFRGTFNKEKLYQKRKNAGQREKEHQKRVKQKQIYANEIKRFQTTELQNREKEYKQRNYLYFLKRIPGSLFEHKYVWRERKDMSVFRRNHMMEYFDDMGKYNYEKYKASQKKDNVAEFAQTVSQKWLENHEAEFTEGMKKFYKKKEELTPSQIKKTLRQIETKPKNTREIIKETIQSLQESTHKRPATSKWNDDDSSDDEWELKYYRVSQTPLPRQATQELETNQFRFSDNGFYSSYASKPLGGKRKSSIESGFSTSPNHTMRSTAYKSNAMGFSRGFAKDKLQQRDRDLFEKTLTASQRASSQGFYNREVDEDFEPTEKGRTHQQDFNRALQGVKIDNDKEIMGLIYEEQRRELERKSALNEATDYKEKKYLNKVFAAEKASYNSQYQKLTNLHEGLEKRMRNTYASN